MENDKLFSITRETTINYAGSTQRERWQETKTNMYVQSACSVSVHSKRAACRAPVRRGIICGMYGISHMVGILLGEYLASLWTRFVLSPRLKMRVSVLYHHRVAITSMHFVLLYFIASPRNANDHFVYHNIMAKQTINKNIAVVAMMVPRGTSESINRPKISASIQIGIDLWTSIQIADRQQYGSASIYRPI